MNPEIKAQWVAALRSKDYKQTTQQLRRGNKFCCLGVLCNLHAIAHPEIAAKETDPRSYFHSDDVLPKQVMKWAGLKFAYGGAVTINGEVDTLDSHNDNGVSFNVIATAIEEQL